MKNKAQPLNQFQNKLSLWGNAITKKIIDSTQPLKTGNWTYAAMWACGSTSNRDGISDDDVLS